MIEGQPTGNLIEPRSVVGVERKLPVSFEGTKKCVLEDIGCIIWVAASSARQNGIFPSRAARANPRILFSPTPSFHCV